MSRIESYHRMLQAASQFQYNIALILEAKALEASRSCQWICGHLNAAHFEDHGDQLKKSLEVHDQMIEVIEGMTKMELALAKHLQILLGGSESGGTNSADGDGGNYYS
ncbi:hypothetical protein [Paenibacillus ehimensis]|uniref:Restriction endonuclease subunit S n=1 Tax=Paenibacillus ehimensis TaxID=79264 RepID=A0ABT8V6Y0_9BACL|nr:hypothetical protein [Paenibacillus ehimensis]MDO3676022.1 hypothetical protein [Paenibacillus ehimensis]MEC0213354.1 hypothetical protein [Paenibacillus ehimensis]